MMQPFSVSMNVPSHVCAITALFDATCCTLELERLRWRRVNPVYWPSHPLPVPVFVPREHWWGSAQFCQSLLLKGIIVLSCCSSVNQWDSLFPLQHGGCGHPDLSDVWWLRPAHICVSPVLLNNNKKVLADSKPCCYPNGELWYHRAAIFHLLRGLSLSLCELICACMLLHLYCVCGLCIFAHSFVSKRVHGDIWKNCVCERSVNVCVCLCAHSHPPCSPPADLDRLPW